MRGRLRLATRPHESAPSAHMADEYADAVTRRLAHHTPHATRMQAADTESCTSAVIGLAYEEQDRSRGREPGGEEAEARSSATADRRSRGRRPCTNLGAKQQASWIILGARITDGTERAWVFCGGVIDVLTTVDRSDVLTTYVL